MIELWNLLLERAGPVGVLIMAGSLVATFIVLDRLWAFRRLRLRELGAFERVGMMAAAGDTEGALDMVRGSAHPLAVTAAALLGGMRTNRGRGELMRIAERTASSEVRSLHRFLPTLSLISHVAPLLGLLGTVTGMIEAFRVIQNVGGKVNASVLAGGIWEAMLTTAMGLSVAIPAFIAYTLLAGKVERFAEDARQLVDSILDGAGYAEVPDAMGAQEG